MPRNTDIYITLDTLYELAYILIVNNNETYKRVSQEQAVAVEKDPFNIVPQDYIINCQWKLKTVKTLTNLGKD